MASMTQEKRGAKSPLPGEVEEAKRNPGGWVYRIAGVFERNAAVPPDAIVGAWKVDAHGIIVGEFIPTPAYRKK